MIRRFSPGDVGSTKEKSQTITLNKFRKTISRDFISERYSEEDMLELYFNLRCYEINAKFSEYLKRNIIREAKKRISAFSFMDAIDFVNDKLVEETKIDLTIQTEYVRGNNRKAREITNARLGKKENREPNIKDVLSGDYSRK